LYRIGISFSIPLPLIPSRQGRVDNEGIQNSLPLDGRSCEKIEKNVVMSIKISIISTPQFPKIEFFHTF